jgi:hypothetical protein
VLFESVAVGRVRQGLLLLLDQVVDLQDSLLHAHDVLILHHFGVKAQEQGGCDGVHIVRVIEQVQLVVLYEVL